MCSSLLFTEGLVWSNDYSWLVSAEQQWLALFLFFLDTLMTDGEPMGLKWSIQKIKNKDNPI